MSSVIDDLINAGYLDKSFRGRNNALMEAVSKQNAKDIWEVARFVNWSKNSGDIESISSKLNSKFTKASLEDAEQEANKLAQRLINMSIKKKLDTGGDDQTSDIAYEVISRGRAFYNRVLKKPSIMEEMSEDGDYNESFIYVFQGIDELEEDSDPSFEKYLAEADESSFDGFISRLKRLTASNNHNAAYKMVAKHYGLSKYVKLFSAVGKIVQLEGHLPSSISQYEYDTYRDMMKFIKREHSDEYDDVHGSL